MHSALEAASDHPHPNPPPLPVKGSVLQGFFPRPWIPPVQIVTYDPDLLAVNRPEVPTNPCSGRLGLLEWLAELRGTFY